MAYSLRYFVKTDIRGILKDTLIWTFLSDKWVILKDTLTLSIVIFSITVLSIMTLSIMTLRTMALSRMILVITILSMMALSMTLRIDCPDGECHIFLLCWVSYFYCYADCHSAKCRCIADKINQILYLLVMPCPNQNQNKYILAFYQLIVTLRKKKNILIHKIISIETFFPR